MRYWAKPKTGEIRSVESYSHNLEIDGAREITKEQFDSFRASLKPEPYIDPVQEKLESIESRLDALEQAIPFTKG